MAELDVAFSSTGKARTMLCYSSFNWSRFPKFRSKNLCQLGSQQEISMCPSWNLQSLPFPTSSGQFLLVIPALQDISAHKMHVYYPGNRYLTSLRCSMDSVRAVSRPREHGIHANLDMVGADGCMQRASNLHTSESMPAIWRSARANTFALAVCQMLVWWT